MDAATAFEKMLSKEITVNDAIKTIEKAVRQCESAVEKCSASIAKIARLQINDGKTTPRIAELMLQRAEFLRSMHQAKHLLAEARSLKGSKWQVV
jgi:hypothetical protein